MAAQDWRILLKVDFERRILRGLRSLQALPAELFVYVPDRRMN